MWVWPQVPPEGRAAAWGKGLTNGGFGVPRPQNNLKCLKNKGKRHNFPAPTPHVEDPHPTGGHLDPKVWVWVRFSCLKPWRPETWQDSTFVFRASFSIDWRHYLYKLHRKPWEEGKKSTGEKYLNKIQWRDVPETTDFFPLSWSNASWSSVVETSQWSTCLYWQPSQAYTSPVPSKLQKKNNLVSVIFLPAVLGLEMAVPMLWAPGICWFFRLENPPCP